jgi:predicted nuclease of restriction endonuclease-like (RecB) superfamily
MPPGRWWSPARNSASRKTRSSSTTVIEPANRAQIAKTRAELKTQLTKELRRQEASCLHDRLAIGRDKKGVKQLAGKGQVVTRPEYMLKEPLVLEFLGLDEKTGYATTFSAR